MHNYARDVQGAMPSESDRDNGQIRVSLNGLASSIELLQKSIDVLASRIDAVLTPLSPEKTSPDSLRVATISMTSPLAESIRSQSTRIDDLSQTLARLTNRVEL